MPIDSQGLHREVKLDWWLVGMWLQQRQGYGLPVGQGMVAHWPGVRPARMPWYGLLVEAMRGMAFLEVKGNGLPASHGGV